MCYCRSSPTQKAATPGKGKAKVVLLENVSSSIPKDTQLKNVGRIAEVAFHRSMTAEETRKHVQGVGNVNTICRAIKTTLLKCPLNNGCGVINLAWCDSL